MDATPRNHRSTILRISPWVLACAPLLTGCRTTRVLAVESVPAGALVRFDEEIIGRTPLEHEFVHYGKRRLTLYLPGYHTWSERIELDAPIRAYFPLDVVTELIIPMGLTDRREFHVELRPDTGTEDEGEVEIDAFLERAWARRATPLPVMVEETADEDPEAPEEDRP